MNKNIKIVVGVVVIALVIWAIATGSHKGPQTNVIKIGVIAPQTGPGAVFGNAVVAAIKMAQADIKGNKDIKNAYEVLIQDDGTNPAQSASAAQKLINVDNVQAIISMTSGTGNAIAPIADAAHVVHICTCTDTRVGYGKYNFTNLVMPDDEAVAYVGHVQALGIKTVAMMTQNHPGINAIADAARAALTKAGIKIVLDEKFQATDRDFKTLVSKAQKAKADTNYVVSYPPMGDILGKQLNDAHVGPISASATFGVSADPTIFEGDWQTDGSASAEFMNRFETQNPGVVFNFRSAPYAYDDYIMLVRGFETGTPDIASYVGSLTSFDGVVGHVTRSGNNFRSAAGLYTVTKGKVVPLK